MNDARISRRALVVGVGAAAIASVPALASHAGNKPWRNGMTVRDATPFSEDVARAVAWWDARLGIAIGYQPLATCPTMKDDTITICYGGSNGAFWGQVVNKRLTDNHNWTIAVKLQIYETCPLDMIYEIARHELGHGLQFVEHNPIRDSVMYANVFEEQYQGFMPHDCEAAQGMGYGPINCVF